MEEEETNRPDSWAQHWHVIVYLLGLVFMGGILYGNIAVLASEHVEFEARFKEDDTRERRDAVEINKLNNEQNYIEREIKELKADVKENADKLDEILRQLQRN